MRLHFSKEEVIYLRENQWPKFRGLVVSQRSHEVLRKARHLAFWFAVRMLEEEGNERLMVDCTRASHAPFGA